MLPQGPSSLRSVGRTEPDGVPSAFACATIILLGTALRAHYQSVAQGTLDGMLDRNPAPREGFERNPMLRKAVRKRDK